MSRANEERKLKHLFDGGAWNVYEPNILNLGVGAPGTDLLESCCDIFQQATEHCLQYEKKENQSLIFQYGPTNGCFEVRREIATYFSAMYDSPVNCEDLIITAGATNGLHLLLSTLIDFQGYIFVDEFTYMIALDSMKHFTSLTIVPVKLNDDGVDLQDLGEKVAKHKFSSQSKEFWGMYYTIPTYHNPTGILFSPEVCRGIVQLARKYDFIVVCDDVYNILHYGERPEARLLSYDVRSDPEYAGHVISNCSFSKILGPGLRLGWLEVPPRIRPILEGSGLANSGGCFNNYTAGIVGSLFELNLAQKQIAHFHKTYKERMLATTETLRAELPKGCKMISPSGGYFIWIRLPKTLDARKFLEYSLEHQKIAFIAGPRFASDGESGKQLFRLSIGFHGKAKLVDGARRLCQALKDYMMLETTP
ncbi:uncharacterized protein YER152C [Drosophila miranda]|uniref:uncharacterized protein YER152C n=1 Tax=Drosophila miranda TaxID=7229 RepID=UPI0007E7ABEE|nr:uncharacterized protein YER152C [Drosophila miranda]